MNAEINSDKINRIIFFLTKIFENSKIFLKILNFKTAKKIYVMTINGHECAGAGAGAGAGATQAHTGVVVGLGLQIVRLMP